MSNNYLAALCRKLTYNGAENLRGTILDPHEQFPDLLNGGRPLYTGRGKWTTLAGIGVENHLKSLGLAEDRLLPWDGRDGPESESFCLTPLGKELAQYLDEHWSELVCSFRNYRT